MTSLRTLTIAALLMLAVACGSDKSESVAPPQVTSTAETFVAPTTERLVQQSSAAVWELLGLTTIRDVPAALERESPRLSSDEVTELWNQFIGGSVQVDNVSAQRFFELCSDGTGRYLDWWTPALTLTPNGLDGETFTWKVFKDRGGSWNSGKMEFTPDDSSLDLVLSATNFAFARDGGAWVSVFPGIEFIVFDSPNCD